MIYSLIPSNLLNPNKMDNVVDSSMFIYSAGLLFAAESLLKHASIYVEDKKLLAEIEAHLERVEQFYKKLNEHGTD